MQFENGISQWIGDAEAIERRPNAPDRNGFGSASSYDEAADTDIVTGLNSHPSRKIEGLRSWRGAWGWR